MKYKMLGCGFLVVILFIVLAFGPARYFWELAFNNPDSVASREYQRAVRSFDSSEITGKEDLLGRLNIIDSYFIGLNQSSLYNGEKTDVTYDQMVTLFNEPSETIQPVDVSDADTVYQYLLDKTTLNFHERNDVIKAFYLEDFSGVTYDEQTLDDIFLTAVNKLSEESAQAINYNQNDYSPLYDDAEPTRKVYMNDVNNPYHQNQYFYDDGQAEFSPEEYVLLKFETRNGELGSMTRRYREPFHQATAQESITDNEEIWERLSAEFTHDNIENNDYVVQDLQDLLGDIHEIHYQFSDHKLTISWFLSREDNSIDEIRADVEINEGIPLEGKDNLSTLKVTAIDTIPQVHNDSRLTNTIYIAQ